MPRKADSTDSTDGLPERGKPQTGPVEAGIMQTGRVVKASGLVLLMVLSTVAAPASAQEVAQDPKQPSVENPHMHFWGDSGLNNCWTHFDRNDSSGSASEGYGESEVSSGRHDIDISCKIQDNFKQDMYLNPNGTIEFDFAVDVYAPGQCNTANPCENLNVTIWKGSMEVARQEYAGIDTGNVETRNLQIDVTENMTRWNKSVDEPIVQFTWVGYADSGLQCVVFLCDSYFRLYYSENPDNYSVEMNFPVVNQTLPGAGGEDEGGIGGAISDAVPGFGLIAGISALALAAVGASRFSREE